ncbi:MAG: sensor histidine kinase [Geminicoccaceae bacterium]
MTRRRSLRLRLLAGGAVLILLAVTATGLALAALFREHLDAQYDSELVHQLDSLTATFELDQSGRPALRTPPADPRFHEAYGGRYWQIDAGSAPPLRSRSLWDRTLSLPRDLPAPGELHRHEIEIIGLGRLNVVERAVRLADRPEPVVRIAVALPVAEIEAVAGRFDRLLWISMGTLALGLLLASAFQVTVGLAPLAALERALARIRSGIARRMEGAVPIEVAGVVDELNGLLAERERKVERARAEAADLAHALKTPLQLLLLDAERLATDRPESADAVRTHSQRMQAVVERHLARARLQARRRSDATANLQRCAEGVTRALAPLAAVRGVAIECLVPGDLSCPGEAADLEEILGNLVENACKWARSRVRLSAARQERDVVITVEDDGPGLPEAERDRALVRGQRLDETAPGYGLGLTIVREVVEGLGGWLHLARSPMGGLRVEAHFLS